MSTTSCPVFHPTKSEFSDFKSYIRKIKDDCQNVGICKIIPPSGWFHRTYNLSDLDEEIKVDNPLKQILSGRVGVYNASLLEIKAMSITEIYNYANKNSVIGGEDFANDYIGRERKFWRSLGNASEWDHPIYGADVPGSLFGSSTSSWNVNNLEDSVLSLLDQRIPGVNTSYLYIGTWRSLFAIHTEDFDLFSINYVHTGECKSWYAVPVSDRQRFESMAQGYFPEDHQQCKEFLRHKTKLFSPSKLKQHGIAFSTVLQHAGEFVVTFPGSYHFGFNHGFNIAESTNFATPDWFEIGSRAHHCVCRPGSVRIDVPYLEALYLRHGIEIRRRKQEQKQNKLKSKQVYNAMENYFDNNDINNSCSNSLVDEQRLRCKCGKDKPLVIVDHACLYSCYRCGLFSHYECMPQYNISSNNKRKTSETKLLLCYICETIDNIPDIDDDETADDTNSNSINKTSKQSSHDVSASTPPPSSSSSSVDMTSNSNSNTKRKRSKSYQVAKLLGQHVISEDGSAVGVVTSIEDDMCRVHKKGTRREDDRWIEAHALAVDTSPCTTTTTTATTMTTPQVDVVDNQIRKRKTKTKKSNLVAYDLNTKHNIDSNTCNNSSSILLTPVADDLTIQAKLNKNLKAIGGEETSTVSSTLLFQRMVSSPSVNTNWYDKGVLK